MARPALGPPALAANGGYSFRRVVLREDAENPRLQKESVGDPRWPRKLLQYCLL